MADVSKIKLSDNTEYDIKDAIARQNIATTDGKTTEIIEQLNNPTYTTTEGTDLSIDNTRVGKMKFEYYGNTSQNGTPTSANPVEVKTVTGLNTMTIENEDGTQSQSYEINLGTKNLFDKNNINLLDGYYIDGTGKIVAGSNNKFNWVKLSPNTTYTLNQTIVSNVTRRVALYNSQPAANSTGTLIGTFSGTKPIDITFNSNNYSYIGWVYCNTANLNGHTYEEMIDSIVLAKGTTLDFITNNPIELCKIGNYQDYIYTNGGKWFKHKEVGKVVFDGSETGWNAYLQDNNTYAYYKNISNSKQDYTNLYNLYNYFIWAVGNVALINSEASIGGTTLSKNGNFLFCVGDTTNKLAEFKAWLSTHNVNAYYVLATPIEEEITEPILINQLNAIKYGAESYYGQTNIIVTSEELQPTLKVQTMNKIV